MQIIGAGFGRTGTMTTQAALESLGFRPCYHMKIALPRFWHLRFWIRAGRGEAVDFRRFLRGYRAALDWPACEFYRELMEIYPEAKVILTVRDPEAWYESMRQTIWAIQPHFPWWFPPSVRKVHDEVIWGHRFHGRFTDKNYTIGIFKRHIEEVRESVPHGRLLVYDVKEGWGPLCEFLGVQLPGRPFPHLNDKAWFRRMIIMLRIIEWLAPAAVLGVIMLVILLMK
jgi:hypothetical protein